jgi:hypothetical protein
MALKNVAGDGGLTAVEVSEVNLFTKDGLCKVQSVVCLDCSNVEHLACRAVCMHAMVLAYVLRRGATL